LAIKTGQIRSDRPRQELRIGYAGRIQDYQKRISDLKSLVSKLSTLPGNYCFEIAGDGTHLPELIAFFDTNHYDNITIRFHGLIESVNMPDFWSNIDVAILFSSHEGLSISMIESMAAGCVQMVTNVSGVSDSVVHGIRGFIHEVGDTTEMANHLQLLHDNPEQLRLMSEACINHVKRHHDPDHYDEVLLSLTRQAWEQPQRYWPRFKRLIPPEVSAGFKNKNRVNHNISLKGRIKLRILSMINASNRNDSNVQN
jgi:glycosyltransferase involved in cell wall biosynthesis